MQDNECRTDRGVYYEWFAVNFYACRGRCVTSFLLGARVYFCGVYLVLGNLFLRRRFPMVHLQFGSNVLFRGAHRQLCSSKFDFQYAGNTCPCKIRVLYLGLPCVIKVIQAVFCALI